jgi:hypothetical protein
MIDRLTIFDIEFLIYLYGFWFSVKLTLYLIRLLNHLEFSIRNGVARKSTFGIWSTNCKYLGIIPRHGALVPFHKVLWKTVFDSCDIWYFLVSIYPWKGNITIVSGFPFARSDCTLDGHVVKCSVFQLLNWGVALKFVFSVPHLRRFFTPRDAWQ